MGIGQEFLEKTRFEHMGSSAQAQGAASPPVEESISGRVIELPSPSGIEVPGIDLRVAIEERRSVRDYTDTPLTLEELSFLLWCTQGVCELYPSVTLRTVPSAGARHALETFLLVNNVRELPPGLYYFKATAHALTELTLESTVAEAVAESCLGQNFIRTAAVNFIWTAVPYRMCWRYGERGYRYLHLDAGHACQNLYLAARAVTCGVCAIGAYHDAYLNEIMGLDGLKQFVIYLAAVGKVR